MSEKTRKSSFKGKEFQNTIKKKKKITEGPGAAFFL